MNLLAPNFQHTLNANENSKKWMSKLLFLLESEVKPCAREQITVFKYYNSNCHCKTEHVEKYKNSTFASKAAKSSAGFLFRVTHPSME